MRAKLIKIVAGLAALTALALGGATLASGQGSSTPATPAPVVQTAPASVEKAAAESPVDTDAIEDENGKGDATEPAGTETEAADQAETDSEVADDDGPGGHADEPDNPKAEHQSVGDD